MSSFPWRRRTWAWGFYRVTRGSHFLVTSVRVHQANLAAGKQRLSEPAFTWNYWFSGILYCFGGIFYGQSKPGPVTHDKMVSKIKPIFVILCTSFKSNIKGRTQKRSASLFHSGRVLLIFYSNYVWNKTYCILFRLHNAVITIVLVTNCYQCHSCYKTFIFMLKSTFVLWFVAVIIFEDLCIFFNDLNFVRKVINQNTDHFSKNQHVGSYNFNFIMVHVVHNYVDNI